MAETRGMVIALCGPDGSGKTTVAEALADHVDGEVLQIHHKPAFLPYPESAPERDFTQPHALAPRGRIASLAKCLYLYLDWLLAWLLRFRPHLARGGWVVIQRPWADMLVDPARYRLDLPAWLLRFLGRLLPHPDLTVLLTAEPAVISRRKEELEPEEIEAQNLAWLNATKGAHHRVTVDVDQSVEGVVADLLDAVESAPCRWGHISLQGNRWLLPRAPRRAALSGLRIHQPLTGRDRLRAAVAHGGALLSLTRLVPATSAPPQLKSKVDPWLEDGGTFAARRLRDGERWFVQLIGSDGAPGPALKLAVTDDEVSALRTERDAIEAVANVLEPPLAAPTLIEVQPGALVMEPVRWRHRPNPLALPTPVASGLGELFAATATRIGSSLRGRIHGDLAPWNIMWDGRRWFLLDWEESRPDGEPFHDLFHHYVQSHALMGRPHAEALVAGARGNGEVGRSVIVYAEAAGLDPGLAVPAFTEYLIRSTSVLDTQSRDFEIARRRRLRLLDDWRRDIGIGA